MTKPGISELNKTQAEKLLAAVIELNCSIDPDTLLDRLHQTFAFLFGCDLTAYNEADFKIDNGSKDLSSNEAANDGESRREYVAFEVLFEGSDYSRTNAEASFSDQSSLDQTSRSFVPADVRHQLGLTFPVSNAIKVDVTLSRTGSAFTEDDKSVLLRLLPHVVNAIKSAHEARRMMDASDHFESLLSRVSRGFVTLSTDGDVVNITDRALATLEKHFTEWDRKSEMLPKPIGEWIDSTLRKENRFTVTSPLRLTRASGELRFLPVYDRSIRSITLLIEERARISPSHLAAAGLTEREVEILQLMEAGKPDSVIATLLDISYRTVQKHVENIFRKLNAETRTEAVHKATDLVRFVSSDSFLAADLDQPKK